MGAFGCLIFGVAKTGHFYGVGTGIALYLRDLCSVIPLISCCDWRYRYENVEYVVLVSIMILSLKRQVFIFKVVVIHFGVVTCVICRVSDVLEPKPLACYDDWVP